MKYLLIFIFNLLLWPAIVFGQRRKAREAAIAAPAGTEVADKDLSIDTLRIPDGHMYVLIIDISPYSVLQEPQNTQEEDELKANFKENNIKIINIRTHTFVVFENKQTLDFSSADRSYQAFAYWTGDLSDEVQLKETRINATEFVAGQMGIDKQSSYNINTLKWKNEIADWKNKNNITAQSEETMNAFLVRYVNAVFDESDQEWLLPDYTKVKKAEAYFIENTIKNRYKTVDFNEQGQPVLITRYDRKGDPEETEKFVYEKGMLRQMNKNGKITTISYDNDKMILFENMAETEQTHVMWLHNNHLFSDIYTIVRNDAFADLNSFSKEKIEKNCIIRVFNNVVWSRECSSTHGAFPFVYTYTSYQSKKVLIYYRYKIEQKKERLFEKYHFGDTRQGQKDKYTLAATYELNEQKLLSTLTVQENNQKQVMKIDYTLQP